MASDQPQDNQGSTSESYDAYLKFNRTRLGEMVSWGWADGRRTITPEEHEAAREYTKKAENQLDYSQLESGDVVAYIWMKDETVDSVEWHVDE